MKTEGPPTAPTAGIVRSHEPFDERGRDTDRTFACDIDGGSRPGPPSPTARLGGSEVLLVPTWTADGRVSCDFTRSTCRGT